MAPCWFSFVMFFFNCSLCFGDCIVGCFYMLSPFAFSLVLLFFKFFEILCPSVTQTDFPITTAYGFSKISTNFKSIIRFRNLMFFFSLKDDINDDFNLLIFAKTDLHSRSEITSVPNFPWLFRQNIKEADAFGRFCIRVRRRCSCKNFG